MAKKKGYGDETRGSGFAAFLMEAKRRTYAGQDDDAGAGEPLLRCSKQLEWRDRPLFYRDIYFGMSLFTGLETVYRDDVAVWAMSYSGGVVDDTEPAEVRDIYHFLRVALREVPADAPFRGPALHVCDDYTYIAKAIGHTDRFEGREEICHRDRLCYSLVYAGGQVAPNS